MMKKIPALFLIIAMLVSVFPTVSAEETDAFAMSPEEREVLLIVNRERLSEGLSPLTAFPVLQNAAGIRAEELVTLYSHTRPDGSRCFTALDELGINYSNAGENIAVGQSAPQYVMNAWMHSEGHRNNILNRGYTHLGVGYRNDANTYYTHHWVQLFTSYHSCNYTSVAFDLPGNMDIYPDEELEDLGITLRLNCNCCGECYMPLNKELCTGYDPKQVGNQTVTVSVFGLSASFTVNVLEHEHTFISVDYDFCDKVGYTEHTCSVCGYSYIEEGTVPPTHRCVWIVVAEPTYSRPGRVISSCTRCCPDPLVTIDLPYLNDEDYTLTVTTPPTCIEQGYGIYTYIKDDLELHFESWLPYGDHEYESSVVEPTCTENGHTLKTCLVCGICNTDDRKEALGHSYENGVCTRCGQNEDELLEPELPGDPFFPFFPFEPELPGDSFEPELPGDSFEPEEPDTPSAPSSNPFKDVTSSDYFCQPVLWAVENGITNGMSPTSFAPNANCTRGQIVTFLWRACGSPEPTKTDNPFRDVKSNEYYYKAVLWAVEKGITTGLSATTFGSNATCTRGQVATFLWRAQGKPVPKSTDNPFSDVRSSDYYFEAVLWAVENDVTQGVGGGKFAPNASCTRGQIVTFLYRAIA